MLAEGLGLPRIDGYLSRLLHLAAEGGNELTAEARDIADGGLRVASPEEWPALGRHEAIQRGALERGPNLCVLDLKQFARLNPVCFQVGERPAETGRVPVATNHVTDTDGTDVPADIFVRLVFGGLCAGYEDKAAPALVSIRFIGFQDCLG